MSVWKNCPRCDSDDIESALLRARPLHDIKYVLLHLLVLGVVVLMLLGFEGNARDTLSIWALIIGAGAVDLVWYIGRPNRKDIICRRCGKRF